VVLELLLLVLVLLLLVLVLVLLVLASPSPWPQVPLISMLLPMLLPLVLLSLASMGADVAGVFSRARFRRSSSSSPRNASAALFADPRSARKGLAGGAAVGAARRRSAVAAEAVATARSWPKCA
jgi:hypothetical protein